MVFIYRRKKLEVRIILDGIKQTNIYGARCFVQAAYKFPGDASTISLSTGTNSFEMVNEVQSYELRRSVIELGRCCIVNDLPVGSLRRQQAKQCARKLAHYLGIFAACEHSKENEHDLSICLECTENLRKEAARREQRIASAARLAKEITICSTRYRFNARQLNRFYWNHILQLRDNF